PYTVIQFVSRAVRFLLKSAGAEQKTESVAVVEAPASSQPSPVPEPSAVRTLPDTIKKIVGEFFRPFRQFALLWCLLLLLTDKAVLIWIALVVILLRVIAVLVKLVRLAIISVNWLSELENKIKAYAEGLISKIMAAPEGSNYSLDIRNAFNMLVGI